MHLAIHSPVWIEGFKSTGNMRFTGFRQRAKGNVQNLIEFGIYSMTALAKDVLLQPG